MTTIGPALTCLFAFIGSLPTSDVWEAWDGEETDREGRSLPRATPRRGNGSAAGHAVPLGPSQIDSGAVKTRSRTEGES